MESKSKSQGRSKKTAHLSVKTNHGEPRRSPAIGRAKEEWQSGSPYHKPSSVGGKYQPDSGNHANHAQRNNIPRSEPSENGISASTSYADGPATAQTPLRTPPQLADEEYYTVAAGFPEEQTSTDKEALQREVVELRQQAAYLADRLAAAERMASSAATQREVDKAVRAQRRAEEGRAQALQAAEAAVSEAEAMRGALEGMCLSAAEVEEAALRCAWLARYWGLADRYGVFPAIAAARAAYWGAIAPPPEAVRAAAESAVATPSRQASIAQLTAERSESGGEATAPLLESSSVGRGNALAWTGTVAGADLPLPQVRTSALFDATLREGTAAQKGGLDSPKWGGSTPTASSYHPHRTDSGVRNSAGWFDISKAKPTRTLPRSALGSPARSGSTFRSDDALDFQASRPHSPAYSSRKHSAATTPRAATPAPAVSSTQATAADVVEIERAVREAEALRIEAAVGVAMADQARGARAGFLQLPVGTAAVPPEGPWRGLLGVELGPEEAEEVAWRRAWLAYLWGRAAAAGVAPELAPDRAQFWRHRLTAQPAAQDMQLTAAALQELRVMGIEQRLWQVRNTRS